MDAHCCVQRAARRLLVTLAVNRHVCMSARRWTRCCRCSTTAQSPTAWWQVRGLELPLAERTDSAGVWHSLREGQQSSRFLGRCYWARTLGERTKAVRCLMHVITQPFSPCMAFPQAT